MKTGTRTKLSNILTYLPRRLRSLGAVLLLGGLLTMLYASPAAAVSSYSFVFNWGSQGSGNTNFNNPTGIGVASDFSDWNIYVADRNNNRIVVYNKFGDFQRVISLSFAPYGVTVMGSYLYISNGEPYPNGFVKRIAKADGSDTGTITGLAAPRGLAANNSYLFVVENSSNRFVRYNISTLSNPLYISATPTAFSSPEAVYVNMSGKVYITDTLNDRIVEFNSATGAQTAAYSTGTNSRPSGIVTSRDDSLIYVSLPGSQKIQIYSQLSAPPIYEWSRGWIDPTLTGYTNLNWQSSGLQMAWNQADIYILDNANDRVVQITEGIHQVPKTGSQLTTGNNDDGTLQMGKYVPAANRFTTASEGIQDKLTGLLWANNAACGSYSSMYLFSDWYQAYSGYINCLNTTSYNGFNDWRLPNINELQSLVNWGQNDPGAWLRSSPQNLTGILSSTYFSSTTDLSSNQAYLVVDFGTGLLTSRYLTDSGYAMAVRTDNRISALVPLYQTGQDSCWKGAVPCTGTGLDGETKAGLPLPKPRFIDNAIDAWGDPQWSNSGGFGSVGGDASLFDTLTGLTWAVNGTGKAPVGCGRGDHSWTDSFGVMDCLNSNHYLDAMYYSGQPEFSRIWRLPNISELTSLMPHGGNQWPQNWFLGQGFRFIPETPWTSTLDPRDASKSSAFQVNFYGYMQTSKTTNQPDNLFPVSGGILGSGIRINSGAPVTASTQVMLSLWPPNPMQLQQAELSSDYTNIWTTLTPFAGRAPYTLPSGDGYKTVHVRYTHTDAATSQYSATIKLDTTAPAATASPAGGPHNSSAVLVTISASEPSRIYYTTDGTTPDPSLNPDVMTGISPLSLIVVPTVATSQYSLGTALRYFAKDQAGNQSPEYLEYYSLDQTLPTGTLTIPGETITMRRDANLALTSVDANPITLVRFSEDNGANWTTPEPYPADNWKNYNFNSAGDGVKCVYMQVQDAAGNWSAKIPAAAVPYDQPGTNCILLDTVHPQTTISHTNTWYNATVTVLLGCSDPGGSGCNSIYYTTDGSEPGPTSPKITGSGGSVTINSTTLLRYVALDNANNHIALPFYSQQFNFEITPPTTAISLPGNGARLSEVDTITGSAFDLGGSGMKNVELSITNGTHYVTASQGLIASPTPIWIPVDVDTAGNWSFWTGTVPWTKPDDYTITAHAYDNAGNVSSLATRSFSVWNPGDTATSFILTSQSIKNGAKVNVRGKLTRIPEDTAYHLIGQDITITVTDPLEYGPPLFATYSTTTTDNDGHFQVDDISGLGGFTKEGSYTVTASFTATPVLTASSASLPVMVGATAGYAIIVEGKLSGDPESTTSPPYHNRSHSKTAQRVYETLKSRGFADMDIYNLNYDSTKTGWDATPDKTLIQSLLTTTGATYGSGPFSGQSTIVTKMINNPGPLYIVLVDHGDPDKFYIDTDSATVTITPTELKGWLETYEQALAPYTMPSSQKRIIVNGSCYSGSFIPVLSAAGRVIITSAAANEQSYKGAMEYDGVRSGEFFLEELFARLKSGDSFKSAFDYASDKVRTYTRSGSSNSASAPYFDTAIQHPLLDDDASGSGSNSLSTATGDGALASGLYLGFANDTTNAGNPASILTVTDTVILTDQDSAVLSATTANYGKTLAAWVEIRDPGTILSGTPDNKTQLDPAITRTVLDATDPNGSVSGDEYFGITCNNFTTSGMYEIYYYAQESVSGQPGDISPMKRSVVYRNFPDNDFPEENNFNLVRPANNATLQPPSALIFEWESIAPSTTPPDNSVTYTLEIAEADNPGFTNNGPGTYYKRELIQGNTAIVGKEGGLKSLATYRWRVTAVDRYGATKLAANAPYTFGTDNGNMNQIVPVLVKVYDNATMAAVNDAVVRVATTGLNTTDNSCTSGKLPSGASGTAGECVLAVTSGVTLTLETTKTGSYQLKNTSINAPEKNPPTIPIPLTGTALQPIKIAANYYADLVAAYTAAADSSTIQLKAQTFTGTFSFSRNISIKLEGGYDATYSATRTGYSELAGPVTINGTTGCQVTFDQVVVK